MKIRIVLSNSGGELDRLTMDVRDDDAVDVSEQIHGELDAWLLSPGDTIKIVEVS
jgi:hypothetical protein